MLESCSPIILPAMYRSWSPVEFQGVRTGITFPSLLLMMSQLGHRVTSSVHIRKLKPGSLVTMEDGMTTIYNVSGLNICLKIFTEDKIV